MESKLQELKARLLEISNLHGASALLAWDQSTYMPPGGTEARARQMATLGQLAHEKQVDPALGKLLDELQPYGENLPYDSDERAIKVPPSFVAESQAHGARSQQAWREARPADDFAKVQPYLEKTVDLSRQYADFFPGYEHVADPAGPVGLWTGGHQALWLRPAARP